MTKKIIVSPDSTLPDSRGDVDQNILKGSKCSWVNMLKIINSIIYEKKPIFIIKKKRGDHGSPRSY